MIPSKGLRWSSQAIGTATRQRNSTSIRQLSSVQYRALRSSPSISQGSQSILQRCMKSPLPKASSVVGSVATIRFASTTPIANSTSSNPGPASASPVTDVPPPESTPLDFDFSTSLLEIPEHIGYLKKLGLDYGWGPTSIVEWTLEHIHIYAQTPWWGSIVLTAITIRLALIPFYLSASDNAAKMTAVAPMVEPIKEKMKAASAKGDTAKVLEARTEMTRLYRREGVSLVKGILPMVGAIPAYGSFVLLRAMARLPVPGLETGGILWFADLSIPDPTYLLPLATAAILHLSMRMGGEVGTTTMSAKAAKAVSFVLPLISFLFTFWLPAAVQISFMASSIFSTLATMVFRNKRFRRLLKMHPLPSKKAGSPDSGAYKGTMQVRAPMSGAELNSTYQSGRKVIQDSAPSKGGLSQTLGKAFGGVKGAIGDARETMDDMKDTAFGSMAARATKAQKAQADAYEAKRQAQIKVAEEEARRQLAERKRSKSRKTRKAN